MPQRKTTIPEKVRKLTDRRAFPVAITVLQIVAAAFFAVDAIEDYLVEAKHGFSLATAIEFFIAVALLGGIFLSSRYVENGGAIFDHGSGGIVLLRAA